MAVNPYPGPLTLSPDRDDERLTALVRQVRAGRPEAFDQLAQRVRNRIRRWASSVTLDDDDAEDVAQEVLLTLYRHAGDFDGRSRFSTWLYRITRQLALARGRTALRRDRLLARRTSELLASTVVEAEQDDGSARLADLVRAFCTELSPRQQQVFELAEMQGLTSIEIGRRLGISASSARATLLQARRAIRLRILEHHPQLLKEFRS